MRAQDIEPVRIQLESRLGIAAEEGALPAPQGWCSRYVGEAPLVQLGLVGNEIEIRSALKTIYNVYIMASAEENDEKRAIQFWIRGIQNVNHVYVNVRDFLTG